MSFFLGVEVQRGSSSLHLSQSWYVMDLLSRVDMEGCKYCPTPASTLTQLSQSVGTRFSDVRLYWSIVGALQYHTITRPDISFIVNKLSQYMHQPLYFYWSACEWVLRYLKGTLALGIHLRPFSHHWVQGYTDADWASNVDDCRSMGGIIYFLAITYCLNPQRNNMSLPGPVPSLSTGFLLIVLLKLFGFNPYYTS